VRSDTTQRKQNGTCDVLQVDGRPRGLEGCCPGVTNVKVDELLVVQDRREVGLFKWWFGDASAVHVVA
jgi:hypothetical protein